MSGKGGGGTSAFLFSANTSHLSGANGGALNVIYEAGGWAFVHVYTLSLAIEAFVYDYLD